MSRRAAVLLPAQDPLCRALVKPVVPVVASAIGGLLALPLVAGGTSGQAMAGCGDVPRVLDTIRTLESGGDYTARAFDKPVALRRERAGRDFGNRCIRDGIGELVGL